MLRSYFSELLLLVGAVVLAVAPVRAEQISVFAAASLQEAVSDVIAGFEGISEHTVTASFAGSSTLARQVEYGAPVDVVMLANINWMTYLNDKDLLVDNTENIQFGNRLALVVPTNLDGLSSSSSSSSSSSGDETNLSEILKSGKVAIAFVEAVPAGIYGKEALQSLGLWEAIRPNVVETDNVRTALALVALGEVAAGIVYTTDAVVEDRVRIAAQFPESTHSEIIYPTAVVSGKERPEVVEFMKYLKGGSAQEAFINRGFTVLENTQ